MSNPYRLCVIVVACVVVLGVIFQFSPAQDKAAAVQKWEYKSAHISDINALGKDLSEYGNEGWELVLLVPPGPDSGRNYQIVVFKRPK